MAEWQALPFGLEANLQLDFGALRTDHLEAAY